MDILVFHLCYNAKITLYRYDDNIVTCTRHSLKEEEGYYGLYTVNSVKLKSVYEDLLLSVERDE